MPNDELMPIGAFARRSGLTSSALRFYADSGLLPPAEVDPVTGYRYYSADQVARATALRRLRELAMPLAAVEAVLGAGADEASRLLDEHVAEVVGNAAAVRRKAEVIKAAFRDAPGLPLAVLKGPVLADAVEQVLTAAAHEPGVPALTGLRIEADHEAVTLTATDRYRLSTRTLVPIEPPSRPWAGTVHGDELRSAVAASRRSRLVRLEAFPDGIWFRVAGHEDRHCRLLPEEYPDHRLLLASLGEVTTRLTVAKDPLLRALEELPGERVGLHVADHGVSVMAAADEEHAGLTLPGTVVGPGLRIVFELTTLYPAVSTAIGPDLLIDLRGHDRPVAIRSADRGDLTTLAMPVEPGHSA
ncbi:MerR family transcriptional regulator [Streptomyces sp. NPDC004435]|uniref:DNA polymerase III subunit beta family protein n=1 Tax=Streptomyces sp. NPDC004435 TaxID=3364701 RepID=UPI003694BA08